MSDEERRERRENEGKKKEKKRDTSGRELDDVSIHNLDIGE